MEFEAPLIRVPYESLNKQTKATQRRVDKGRVIHGNVSCLDITGFVKAAGNIKDNANNLSRDDLLRQLNELEASIRDSYSKVSNICESENKIIDTLSTRLGHHEKMRSAGVDGANTTVVDSNSSNTLVAKESAAAKHLVRHGRLKTARALASATGIEHLVDADLFEAVQPIVQGLAKHDIKPAMLWAAENRARLKKLNSDLEFHLCQQAFVELIRKKRYTDAVQYAKNHLIVFMGDHENEIVSTMGLLAVTANLSCAKYNYLTCDKRWQQLSDLFIRDFCTLFALPKQSLLRIALSAGVPALNNAQCQHISERVLGCPICSDEFRDLASKAPQAHHTQSKIVCRITGKVMNDENPPMALPNGQVYSLQALHDMEAAVGHIVCPKTGFICKLSDCTKVYIT